METITGSAAGVPYTAVPPGVPTDEPAPLLVSWHMLDAPRTDAAFAAALPMLGVPAWRVHLGMPMCGARMVDGRPDHVVSLVRDDVLLSFLAPVVRQAAAEFPAALAALRTQLPVDDGPVAALGASLGGAVALRVLTARPAPPIRALALVNPGVRVEEAVPLLEPLAGRPYAWTDDARRTAAELDFVARAGDLTVHPPLLLVSGERDHPPLRRDAAELVGRLRERYARPDDVELTTVADLEHPLADEPGMEPAPQRPVTKVVDEILTDWFSRRLG